MKRLGKFVLCTLISLGGCGGPVPAGNEDRPVSEAEVEADANARAEAEGRIECRIGNARQFERFCLITFDTSEAGRTINLRKPDGGFRRLLVTQDGRGVVAADGAEPATVSIIDDDRIEVTLGGDSFRLPATIAAR